MSVAGSMRGGAVGASGVISIKTRNWGKKTEIGPPNSIRLARSLRYRPYSCSSFFFVMKSAPYLLLLLAGLPFAGHAQTKPKPAAKPVSAAVVPAAAATEVVSATPVPLALANLVPRT